MFFRRSLLTLQKTKVRLLSTSFRGLTGGQIVYESLRKHNVENVFLYSGGAVMPIVDAFYDGKIKYFINTHEQSTGHAATGYAKMSGKTGISIVTSGPALTNSITAIQDAQTDSTPLIVISGQVPLASMGTNAFQECPSVDITKPITKWSYCIDNVENIPWAMNEAFRIAHEGKPGAVHLDIPKCVSQSIYTGTNTRRTIELGEPGLKRASQKKNLYTEEKHKLRNLLEKTQRPIVLLGKGAVNSYKEVRQFVETLGIPVTSTIHAMGIVDETSDLSLQFLGMHGHPAANKAIQEADFIIALGARFDDRITGKITDFAPKARAPNGLGIVHVNICENELDFVMKTDHNYAMDCKQFLSSLQPTINTMTKPDRSEWFKKLLHWKHKYPFMYELFPKTINTQEVIDTMNAYLSDYKYIITTGVGNHQMMAAQFITWKNPRTFITSGSLGVMGTGVPYAIGCQIACPDHIVVNIDGDGSFHHTLAELKTIADYQLPIKIAIMNDGHMSMVKTWESLFYGGRHSATSLGKNPDYIKLASSFGIRGIRCTSRATLHKCIQDFLQYNGPILCDFRVTSDMCLPLVSPGAPLDDMIMTKNIKSLKGDPPS